MRLLVNPPPPRPTKELRRREVIAASHLTQFEIAGMAGRHPTIPLAVMLRRMRPARKIPSRSTKSDGFQVFIRLDNLAQLVLGGAVAAIGVGMVAFHERFETSLDVLRRGAGVEAECIERLAFGIVHGAGLSPPVGTSRTCRPAELTEHAKRIVGSADFRMKAGRAGPRRRPSAVHGH